LNPEILRNTDAQVLLGVPNTNLDVPGTGILESRESYPVLSPGIFQVCSTAPLRVQSILEAAK
jgi:hypothetical protein